MRLPLRVRRSATRVADVPKRLHRRRCGGDVAVRSGDLGGDVVPRCLRDRDQRQIPHLSLHPM